MSSVDSTVRLEKAGVATAKGNSVHADGNASVSAAMKTGFGDKKKERRFG